MSNKLNELTNKMNTITIDSTGYMADLCLYCKITGTDKGPYTANGGHRHPYTAPYSLFFEPLRHKPIKLVEIGVFRGASITVWRNFFSKARIFGFDRDINFLAEIQSRNMEGVYLNMMDSSNEESIKNGLNGFCQDGELYDVIMDDASHSIGDQCLTIKVGLPYLKQGGLLIVEDIFREASEEQFEKVFEEVKGMVSFYTFIVCDHKERYSPGWNNDKMLVLVRA